MNLRDIRDALNYVSQLVQQDADRAKAAARGEQPAEEAVTTPTDTARLTLDSLDAGLRQLRTALADAYGRAGNALTEAGHKVAAAEQRTDRAHAARRTKAAQLDDIKRALLDTGVIQEGDPYGHADLADLIRQTMTDRAHAEQGDASALHLAQYATAAWQQRTEKAEQRAEEAERFKADHEAACRTIADMHEAATGRTGMGPIRGVVEDVADVRARAQEMETDRDRWRDATEERIHRHNDYRRRVAAVLALPANSDFNDIIEYAARTLTRSGEHLLAAEEAVNRRDATLQRVRDADTLADALAAVGEHDGLTPEAARNAAEFAAAAEQPAAINAECERDHAIELASMKHARDEASRRATRAESTLLRIKHARTAADAWTALGTHYHLPATEAGRGARDWRSIAERYATERAEAASVLGTRYMGDAERYQTAWHSARLRAQREASHFRACRISRDAWRRDATAAKAAISRVRALLGTQLGPLATSAVRRALDTPAEG